MKRSLELHSRVTIMKLRWMVARLDALQAEMDALKRLQAGTGAEFDPLPRPRP
jgi:hypothetical protein